MAMKKPQLVIKPFKSQPKVREDFEEITWKLLLECLNCKFFFLYSIIIAYIIVCLFIIRHSPPLTYERRSIKRNSLSLC